MEKVTEVVCLFLGFEGQILIPLFESVPKKSYVLMSDSVWSDFSFGFICWEI